MSHVLPCNLADEALRETLLQRMMSLITPDALANILMGAVKICVSPSTKSWEYGKSPIEIAFEYAVKNMATDTAIDMLKDPVFKTYIDGLIQAAAVKIANDRAVPDHDLKPSRQALLLVVQDRSMDYEAVKKKAEEYVRIYVSWAETIQTVTGKV